MPILACGPFFSTTGLWVSLFILLVVKPATYFAFIQAFRYRASRDVPMSFRLATGLTVVRTLVGTTLLGGVAVVASVLYRTSAVEPGYREALLWGVLGVERLGLWLCLGIYAGLRGRLDGFRGVHRPGVRRGSRRHAGRRVADPLGDPRRRVRLCRSPAQDRPAPFAPGPLRLGRALRPLHVRPDGERVRHMP